MQDKILEDALFTKELGDDFTKQVMFKLEDIEIEPVLKADQLPESRAHNVLQYPSIAAQVKRSQADVRSSRLKIWGAAAATIVLVSSTLLFTQPSLAGMLRSLFAMDGYVDSGMENVRDMGLIQTSVASASNQGYTLKVNEVIADSTRIIIGVDVYDAKGNAVAGQIDYATADFKVSFIDKGNFGDVSYARRDGGNQTTNRIELDFMRAVLTDKLQLDIQIKKLYFLNEGSVIKTIEGNWSLTVEADLAKAKAQTLFTEINNTYETPGGIQIHMQGATRTPSGGSLEFTTKLSPEASQRAVNGQSGFHQLNFRLEDEQGNLVGDSVLFELNRRYELERWSGINQWFYQFNNFPYDKQKIRFVLDSYVIREKSEASVTFDPAKISAEQPAIFEDSGDKLLLHGLQINPTEPGSDDILATIPLGGTVNNEIAKDKWIAIDEFGKEYSVHFAGGISFGISGQFSLADAKFVIDDLDKRPTQLTLKRTLVNRWYRDSKWSFIIPQNGTRGVIPE